MRCRSGCFAPVLVLLLACRSGRGTAPRPAELVFVPPVAHEAPPPPVPEPPPYTPPPGTIVLSVIDEQGTVTANAAMPPAYRYGAIIARCHAPGGAAGHAVLVLQEIDDQGSVHVTRVDERAGVADATLACIIEAIDHAVPPASLSGSLAGHSLADGGWERGRGLAYVTLY